MAQQCLFAEGGPGHEPPPELLPHTQLHAALPAAGECPPTPKTGVPPPFPTPPTPPDPKAEQFIYAPPPAMGQEVWGGGHPTAPTIPMGGGG